MGDTINKQLKMLSLSAVNSSTMAEQGSSRCKKSHKQLIQKKRRALLKIDTLKSILMEV